MTSPLHPVVRTSARMPGRAENGLGDLLARLALDRELDRERRSPADEAAVDQ